MDERTAKLEEISRAYDATKDYDGVLTRYAWNMLQQRIPKAARALEMGCSNGVMTAYLAEHVKELCVVDGSRRYLDEVAAKIPRKDVRYDLAMFEDYAPTARFDAIIMARAVEHLANPRPVLEKVRTWLADGGELHVMVPNAWSFHRLVGVAMGMLPEPHALNDRDKAWGHHRVYDPNTLADELRAAGFEIVEQSGNSLKFLSNDQMLKLSPQLWDAMYEVGKQFPAHGAEIYARCRVK